MSISHLRVLVDTATPTILSLPGDEGGLNLTLQIQNLGTDVLYIGGADLSPTSYGVSIVPGGAVTIDNLSPTDEVYALAKISGTYAAVLKVHR
jgi:hypothetical protein